MSAGGLTPSEAMAVLTATFRVEKLTDATIKIYVQYLSDIQPALLEAAVRSVVAHSRFFPSIAELRYAAAELAGLLPPGAEEALAIIREADVARPICRRDGTYAYTERFWEWPAEVPAKTRMLLQDALERVGDSTDPDGESYFGWAQDFKAAYVRIAGEVTGRALADLTRAAFPPAPVKALTP